MLRNARSLYGLLLALVAASPLSASAQDARAPLLDGMGGLHHRVTARDELAQRYFDQGLTLSYAFNHAEAERSFRQAAARDPQCAMAYWGVALVLGPNYNSSMEPDAARPAYEAIQEALRLAPQVTEKERAFIRALSKRYAAAPSTDRKRLDREYAEAMGEVAERYPDDPDAIALHAEALMDLHPWDLWTRNGEPRSWTPAILEVLERGIERWPDHPAFHHFYIHAVEASRNPERGLPSAARLPDLVPGAGHLVHMPSHIYIRVGRYVDAVAANERAIAVDDQYLAQVREQGIYALGYAPHNHHFLCAAAMLAGQGKKSLSAARHLSMHQDPKRMRDPVLGASVQHYWATPLYVLVRFGEWERILNEPPPAKDLLYPTGVWHYARGMAYLRTGRRKEAGDELEALGRIAGLPEVAELRIWEINKAADLLQIARQVLAGEIAAGAEDYDRAVAHLEKAVALEDGLTYQEPADWHPSVRQNLGAVLLEAGHAADAEEVYRRDLAYVPENGWSLFGLAQALRAQGKDEAASRVDDRFEKAWREADVRLTSSRF